MHEADTTSFPKTPSGQISAMRQNQRIIRRDACDPCSIPRFPPPEGPNPSAMPTKDCFRLNDMDRVKQARPQSGHPNQQWMLSHRLYRLCSKPHVSPPGAVGGATNAHGQPFI